MGQTQHGSDQMADGCREAFFVRDKEFYKIFAGLALTIMIQNLVAYSVNMLDNIMLGNYSQNALAAAAAVNQIFFIVQQTALSMGNALVVLTSQYWGARHIYPIRRLSLIVLEICCVMGLAMVAVCALFPRQLMLIFTTSEPIMAEGIRYLDLIKWTFLLFIISNLLTAMLRSVEVVRISLIISVVSLILNGGINYTLIFGRFGFPEMGIRGAAVGTLTARIVELLIVLFYVAFIDRKIEFFSQFSGKQKQTADGAYVSDAELRRSFAQVSIPIVVSSLIWSFSVPMQTAILGHLSDDAMAANSVSSTFYQYLKVIVIAVSSAAAVMIGKDIGRGDLERVRADGRTISVIAPTVGLIMGTALILLKGPLLSMYSLNDNARLLADHFMIIMGFVMVGMSYQMPVSNGVLQGGGDGRFCLHLNMVATWLIVMPFSFLSAFVWKLPAEMVVLVIQSDQFFKGVPIFLRFRSYKWIHELTK